MDLRDCDDFGQRLDVLQFHGGQRLPVAPAGAGVEELDPRVGHAERSVGEQLFVLEEQEIAPQLGFADLVRRLAAVIGQLADGSQVAVMRPLAEAAQLQVIGHAGIEGIDKVAGTGLGHDRSPC